MSRPGRCRLHRAAENSQPSLSKNKDGERGCESRSAVDWALHKRLTEVENRKKREKIIISLLYYYIPWHMTRSLGVRGGTVLWNFKMYPQEGKSELINRCRKVQLSEVLLCWNTLLMYRSLGFNYPSTSTVFQIGFKIQCLLSLHWHEGASPGLSRGNTSFWKVIKDATMKLKSFTSFSSDCLSDWVALVESLSNCCRSGGF